jgi:hypothetical protein
MLFSASCRQAAIPLVIAGYLYASICQECHKWERPLMEYDRLLHHYDYRYSIISEQDAIDCAL